MRNSEQLTRDALAKFMFKKGLKIKNYNFDVCHDIKKIVAYGYNSDNYRDEDGQLITNEKVSKKFVWMLRDMGSWLWDANDHSNIEHSKKSGVIKKMYELEITPNCDYLHNVEFCKITRIN